MNLKSERLKLKEVTWNDLGNIHSLHSIWEVEEFNTIGIPDNIGVTKEIIRPVVEDLQSKKRKFYGWSIILKKENTFIGMAGMTLSNDKFKMGEIYYKLLPEYWGKGYATETAKTLIHFGFDFLELHRVEAGVATENIRSVKVLEKAGMTREGIRRKILPIRGKWVDNYHYAIVEDDPCP